MTIRLAEEKDYEEIMNLYNNFVGEDRYSKRDNDSFKIVLKSPTNFIFVAEDEGRLVGFSTFSVRNVVRYPKPIAELDELFVGIAFRKHGVGKQLMEAVESKAKELGCYRLYIESAYKHEPAHKFYEDLGYEKYGYHFYKTL
ncbi:MAG TPA: GNAT family N-acetyltransferase [Patescibacteria group bacterium]|nr:GNAT family N-acetyltransferase [Patescibacteria group bacterium]